MYYITSKFHLLTLFRNQSSFVAATVVNNLKLTYYVCNGSLMLAWCIAVSLSGKSMDMGDEMLEESVDEDGADYNEESTAAE